MQSPVGTSPGYKSRWTMRSEALHQESRSNKSAQTATTTTTPLAASSHAQKRTQPQVTPHAKIKPLPQHLQALTLELSKHSSPHEDKHDAALCSESLVNQANLPADWFNSNHSDLNQSPHTQYRSDLSALQPQIQSASRQTARDRLFTLTSQHNNNANAQFKSNPQRPHTTMDSNRVTFRPAEHTSQWTSASNTASPNRSQLQSRHSTLPVRPATTSSAHMSSMTSRRETLSAMRAAQQQQEQSQGLAALYALSGHHHVSSPGGAAAAAPLQSRPHTTAAGGTMRHHSSSRDVSPQRPLTQQQQQQIRPWTSRDALHSQSAVPDVTAGQHQFATKESAASNEFPPFDEMHHITPPAFMHCPQRHAHNSHSNAQQQKEQTMSASQRLRASQQIRDAKHRAQACERSGRRLAHATALFHVALLLDNCSEHRRAIVYYQRFADALQHHSAAAAVKVTTPNHSASTAASSQQQQQQQSVQYRALITQLCYNALGIACANCQDWAASLHWHELQLSHATDVHAQFLGATNVGICRMRQALLIRQQLQSSLVTAFSNDAEQLYAQDLNQTSLSNNEVSETEASRLLGISLAMHTVALQAALPLASLHAQSIAIGNLALCSFHANDCPTALACCLRYIELSHLLQNVSGVYRALMLQGEIHSHMRQFARAKQAWAKARRVLIKQSVDAVIDEDHEASANAFSSDEEQPHQQGDRSSAAPQQRQRAATSYAKTRMQSSQQLIRPSTSFAASSHSMSHPPSQRNLGSSVNAASRSQLESAAAIRMGIAAAHEQIQETMARIAQQAEQAQQQH